MSEYKLTKEIIARSVKKVWDLAKLEWKLKSVYFEDEPSTCLCGHFPIIEMCLLQNHYNNIEVVVGNCCVKKFLGLSSNKIFQAIKRIKKDKAKALNAEAIEYAMNKKWITAWEHDFYIDTSRKRSMTPKQINVRIAINEKIMKQIELKR